MKLEDALNYLRLGYRIYRTSDPEKGSLCGTAEKPLGSFYLTLWDVLADDWDFVARDVNPETEDELGSGFPPSHKWPGFHPEKKMNNNYNPKDCKIFLEHAIEFLASIETEDREIQLNLQIADRLITKAITMLEANAD